MVGCVCKYELSDDWKRTPFFDFAPPLVINDDLISGKAPTCPGVKVPGGILECLAVKLVAGWLK